MSIRAIERNREVVWTMSAIEARDLARFIEKNIGDRRWPGRNVEVLRRAANEIDADDKEI